jgi:hypothetical protein
MDLSSATQALLTELDARPKDESLREKAAHALANEGRHAECVALLSTLRNLTAHDPGPVPCLCKRCLTEGTFTAESGGMKFVRDFAVQDGRVLWYWVPRELLERGPVHPSVKESMKKRLTKARPQWKGKWAR